MNKSNYCLFKEEIEQITSPKKLLLHCCCAPCSSEVITYLTNYFDITVFFYNPNISPIEEYEKRKIELKRLITEIPHKNKLNYLDCDYDNKIYEEKIKGYETCPERGNRCTICFNLRLKKTANMANKYKYDYFCTTLTISPYKNSNLINQIGLKYEKIYNIKWLYSDFKKEEGYKKSIQLSKKYNLYRQDYCGCIYSKRQKKQLSNG